MCLDLYSNRHTTANCLRWEALLCATLIAYINDLYLCLSTCEGSHSLRCVYAQYRQYTRGAPKLIGTPRCVVCWADYCATASAVASSACWCLRLRFSACWSAFFRPSCCAFALASASCLSALALATTASSALRASLFFGR